MKMWTLKLFFVLCFTFLGVQSEEYNITVPLQPATNCSIFQPSYTFREGDAVTFIFKDLTLNHGWLKGNNGKIFLDFTTKTPLNVQGYHNTPWTVEALYLKNTVNQYSIFYKYGNDNYTRLLCPIQVSVVPLPIPPNERLTYIAVISVVSVVAVITITVETICIICLKKKARGADKYNNLTKISMDTLPTDREKARYCSEPVKKVVEMIEPTVDSRPESAIYEAPDFVEQSLSPPSEYPPAIPCTPRPDRNALIQQNSYPTIPRSKPQEQELAKRPPLAVPADHKFEPFDKSREFNIAKRAPIPVPTQEAYEVYEEMDPIEEEKYEPPSVANLPPRAQTLQHPIKPTKPPAGFPQHRLELLPEGQRLRPGTPNKPQTTSKPQTHPRTGSVPANELAEALKRRQTAMAKTAAQKTPEPNHPVRPPPVNPHSREAHSPSKPPIKVPVQTIPEPNSAKPKSSPFGHQPRPQTLKPKPSPPVEEAIYCNQMELENSINQSAQQEDVYGSDEEEWTYEPLKPAHSFNKYMQ